MAFADLSEKYLFYVRRSQDDPDTKAGGLCYLSSAPDGDPHPSIPYCKIAAPSNAILDAVRDWVVPFVLAPPASAEASRADWRVICNPVAGGRKAEVWLDRVILPMLTFAGVHPEKHVTSGPNDTGALGKEFLKGHRSEGPPKVVVMGGDGTTSELLNGIASEGVVPAVDLVPVPLGTANALFFSLWPSADLAKPKHLISSIISALITASDPPRPLPLISVKVYDGASLVAEKVAHVVVSTALHAAILRTADELRSEVEGLERFKQAFVANQSRMWNATVELFDVSVYDSERKEFKAFEDKNLEGSFKYFAAALVDRFEQSFVIAPLRRGVDVGTVDVVVARPPVDIGPVLMKAYENGAHLSDVEYFRCSGWRWTGEGDVCIDGAVTAIPDSVECRVLEGGQVRVY